MGEAKDATKDLATDQVNAISGGDCTLKDAMDISGQLANAYENLIEFTTYVMERVSGQ